MRATTLSYMGPNFEADTGDLLGTLAGLFGGGANAPNLAAGGGPGKTLGGLGGASIAAALGMPQFAPMAASAGSMLGGLAQQGIETLTKPKPQKPRQLTRNERRIIEQGKQRAKQTGNEAFAQEAVLRVQRPAEYKRLKGLGRLPSQVVPPKPVEQPPPKPAQAQVKLSLPPVMTQPAPAPAPAPVAPSAPVRPSLNLAPLFEGLNSIERAQLELAVQEGRGAETWNRIQAERSEQETRSQTRTFRLSEQGAKLMEEESPPFVPEMDGYSETAGLPDERPQPKKHTGIISLHQGQLEGLLRSIPALQKLDKRLLKLLAGLGSKARDVSGVDPKRGVYHAEPGETPNGIAKRLTGRAERVNELYAANPGNAGPLWYIPPGWLAYEPDTGAIMTARRYTVLQNDTPYKIAQKHGAFSTRPKWWTELKQANPDKPVKDGGANWKSLYAGEEIGLPDAWFVGATPPAPAPTPAPAPVPVPSWPLPSPSFPVPIPSAPIPSPFPVPIPSFPMPSPGPGLPGPTQAGTQDPGVYLQAQALLALWAKQNSSACIPADYGANPTDFTGTATPRTTMALASFQAWWNRSRSSSPLRADGVLDEATYRALYSVTAAQIPSTIPAPTPPAPAPNPLPQLPPWLAGMLGGATPPATPTPQTPQIPQVPPWFIPTNSTQNVPPWAVPSFPALPSAPTPAPTPEPSTPEPDDGPAIPLMAMLGAGLFFT